MYILQLKVKSYKLKPLKKFLKNLYFFFKKYRNGVVLERVCEPRYKNKIFTVLKSPHVNKKSKEHFKYKVYKRIIFCKISNTLLLFNFIIFFTKISKIEKFLLSLKIKTIGTQSLKRNKSISFKI